MNADTESGVVLADVGNRGHRSALRSRTADIAWAQDVPAADVQCKLAARILLGRDIGDKTSNLGAASVQVAVSTDAPFRFICAGATSFYRQAPRVPSPSTEPSMRSLASEMNLQGATA